MRLTVPAFAVGLAAGIKVTSDLHSNPDAGKWGDRLGSTRLRYANLPVGGTIAMVVSVLLPVRVAVPARALGAGAVVGAVSWGIADPLPPQSPRSVPPIAGSGSKERTGST